MALLPVLKNPGKENGAANEQGQQAAASNGQRHIVVCVAEETCLAQLVFEDHKSNQHCVSHKHGHSRNAVDNLCNSCLSGESGKVAYPVGGMLFSCLIGASYPCMLA